MRKSRSRSLEKKDEKAKIATDQEDKEKERLAKIQALKARFQKRKHDQVNEDAEE